MKRESLTISILNYANIALFLFSILFLRSTHIVGPVSARNLFALLLGFIAFAFFNVKIKLTKSIKLYFCWLLLYVLMNFFSGQLTNEFVYKNLFAYHLVSLLIIYSLSKIVNTNVILDRILLLFAIFYVFNCIVTILQYQNNALGWAIAEYISPMSDRMIEKTEIFQDEDSMLSISICGGINGFVVTNGYFTACFLPIATLWIWSKNKIKIFLGVVVAGIAIFTAFCIQQRTGFYLSVLCMVVILLFRTTLKMKLLLCLGTLLAMMFVPNGFTTLNQDNFGRLVEMNDSKRSETMYYVGEFLSNPQYLIMGNNDVSDSFNNEMFLTMGHNSFLDSLRRAGFFSLILYIILFFCIFKECISKMSIVYARTSMLALSCLIYLLYSILHSDGIPSGGTFMWIAYILMLQSEKLDHNNSMYQDI